MKNQKSTRKYLLKAVTVLIVTVGLLIVAPVGVHAVDTAVQPGGLPNAQANTGTIQKIMAIAFGIIGAFAFLSVVLSGFKYVTSGGDSQKTSEAKNGVVFSLVGLMIAIAAEGLVVFVIRGP